MAADEDGTVLEGPAHGVGVVEGRDTGPGPAAICGRRDGLVAANVKPGWGGGVSHKGVEVGSGHPGGAAVDLIRRLVTAARRSQQQYASENDHDQADHDSEARHP